MMVGRDLDRAVKKTIKLSLFKQKLLALSEAQQRTTDAALQGSQAARLSAEQARERAEKADRAKMSFIAATSHDLRQPLHALMQYAAHLKRLPTGAHEAGVIAKIDDAVEAMAGLLNAVLDFSKITTGSMAVDKRPLGLAELMQQLDDQTRPPAQAMGLRLVVHVSDGFVLSDAALLARVLGNVAQNAVRYTDAGTVSLRARLRGSVARVLIADTGIGIAPGQRQKIFDEYYQVNNQARNRSKGLGLGLAIVRDLATTLGLRVRVKSRQGAGSVFAIDIALAAPAHQAVAVAASDGEAEPAQDHVRGALVVLIDDDPLARDGLATTLADFGCRVLAASSGQDAAQLIAGSAFAPQLILCDYRLGDGTTGLEVMALLTQQHAALLGPGFPLPAVVISGDTSPEELRRVAAAGYSMLHKPVSASVLHQALNEALAASRDGKLG